MGHIIRVLIAEDSVFIQKILAKIIQDDPGLQLVGVAKNGKLAVDMARSLKPDVITMDIRMPVMDGLEATRIIMAENPTPILVVSSSVNDEDLKISFNAIQAGALDIMEKPRGHLSGSYFDLGHNLIRKIKLIAEIKVFRHLAHLPAHPAPEHRARAKTRSRGVAIGASTGGPSAVFQIVTALPSDFPAPLFITIHISEGFGRGCADWLNRNSRLAVRIPQDGEHIEPGIVYFAPDDRRMTLVSRNFIAVEHEPRGRIAHPITDMMESVAQVYGPQGIGVLLTGMGDDGARGMKSIKKAGGKTIVQDEDTSVVFGMPKEAISLQAADMVLPIERIAGQIINFLQG